MNRSFAGTLVASAIALAVGACGDDSSGDGYASAGGDCSAYTTCGSCTPVPGCGWCFNAHGGACTTDPDECASASEFTWTWDPGGCPDVDASVNAADGGAGAGRDATSGGEAGGGGTTDGGGNDGGGSGNEAGPVGPAGDSGAGG